MKKLFKSIALATVASGAILSSTAMAEEKVAVVNFQQVLASIPQAEVVRQGLEAEFKDDKAILSQLEADIKYRQEKKKRDSSLMSKKEIEDLDKETAALYQDYQKKGQEFQQKLNARQNAEQNKLVALVRQAIDGIAAKEKFDLVFEQRALLYVKPDITITDKVIEQVSKLK